MANLRARTKAMQQKPNRNSSLAVIVLMLPLFMAFVFTSCALWKADVPVKVDAPVRVSADVAAELRAEIAALKLKLRRDTAGGNIINVGNGGVAFGICALGLFAWKYRESMHAQKGICRIARAIECSRSNVVAEEIVTRVRMHGADSYGLSDAVERIINRNVRKATKEKRK